MTPTLSPLLVLWLGGAAALSAWLPRAFAVHGAQQAAFDTVRRLALIALLFAGLLVQNAAASQVMVSAALALQALAARGRDGRAGLGLAAVAHGVAGVALVVGHGDVALAAGLLAIALPVGVAPLHGPAASLAARQPALLIELAGATVVAVWLHVRWLVPAAATLAHDLAVPLVAWGAGGALFGALLALAQRTLRGLWSASFVMHAGMLWAAVGASGRGHVVAAMLVAVTLALALGGFGAMTTALEARVGAVSLRAHAGRVRAFPVLAACFAFFAGAGVGLPGTAGFIADDLLLHALWEEGPAAAVVVIAASALLAIALLRGFSAAFLGPAQRVFRAGDLDGRERRFAAVGIAAACLLGIAPMLLVGPVVSATTRPTESTTTTTTTTMTRASGSIHAAPRPVHECSLPPRKQADGVTPCRN